MSKRRKRPWRKQLFLEFRRRRHRRLLLCFCAAELFCLTVRPAGEALIHRESRRQLVTVSGFEEDEGAWVILGFRLRFSDGQLEILKKSGSTVPSMRKEAEEAVIH